MCSKFVHICFDVLAFPIEKICDSVVEGWVYDPMIRPGCGGVEAAADFVLALRARLEITQSFSYAVVDALVVTGFEMQTMKISETTPVPPIEGIVAAETNSRRDRLSFKTAEDDDKVFGHSFRYFGEKLSIQIGIAAPTKKRVRVKVENSFPLFG